MKKIIFILSLLTFLPCQAKAFGTSLDDLYRKMLVEDYEGSLPTFVTNRNAPEFEAVSFTDKRDTPDFLVKQPEEKKEEVITNAMAEAIEYGDPKPIKSWKDIVVAVQKGDPSPFDIAEITKKAGQKNVEALELLAWIKANGIGTKQDLHQAWELYSIAANLGVENAGQNANAVWKAMNAYQKQTMSPF